MGEQERAVAWLVGDGAGVIRPNPPVPVQLWEELPETTCRGCGDIGGQLTGGAFLGRRWWEDNRHQHSLRYRCRLAECGRRWSVLHRTNPIPRPRRPHRGEEQQMNSTPEQAGATGPSTAGGEEVNPGELPTHELLRGLRHRHVREVRPSVAPCRALKRGGPVRPVDPRKDQQ